MRTARTQSISETSSCSREVWQERCPADLLGNPRVRVGARSGFRDPYFNSVFRCNAYSVHSVDSVAIYSVAENPRDCPWRYSSAKMKYAAIEATSAEMSIAGTPTVAQRLVTSTGSDPAVAVNEVQRFVSQPSDPFTPATA